MSVSEAAGEAILLAGGYVRGPGVPHLETPLGAFLIGLPRPIIYRLLTLTFIGQSGRQATGYDALTVKFEDTFPTPELAVLHMLDKGSLLADYLAGALAQLRRRGDDPDRPVALQPPRDRPPGRRGRHR